MRKIDLSPYILGVSLSPTINGDILFQLDTTFQPVKDDTVSVRVASGQLTPKEMESNNTKVENGKHKEKSH